MNKWLISGVLVASILACLSLPNLSDSQAAVKPRPSAFREYLRGAESNLIAYTPGSAQPYESQREAVMAELRKLREKFDGLSLYSSDDAPLLLECARLLGYRAVLLTVWNPDAEAELATTANLIRRHAGSFAFAVSLGSEGLLQRRYTLSTLASARESLQRRLGPRLTCETTTSEPWWLYQESTPEANTLRGFGDFVTINVHAIWDADIQDPRQAARWTRDRGLDTLHRSGRPVLIREAGLPGDGTSPRPGLGGISFSRQAQAEFWQEWKRLRAAEPHDHPGRFLSMASVFEAIDNPGKDWRDFESSWGLLSRPRLEPHPAWRVFPSLSQAR